MIYKDFMGMKLSTLGLGCMRLPTVNGKDSEIDIPRAEEMFELAINAGINYFDTAWGYHGGHSEEVCGRILSKYPRDSYFIASKFPGYSLSNMDKIAEIFPAQLERCGVDYFDFYLFHNVCEMNIDAYLDPKYGIADYIFEQKKQGRIKHVGFSVHGNIDTTKRFLQAYGKNIEFCQIQLNYLDLTYQDAKAKLELLSEHNIPVWVMEPMRGGKLASLSEDYMSMLRTHRDISAAEWAFRYIQSIPEVTVTLSGMSNMEQLRDNIRIFSENAPLSDSEIEAILSVARDMTEHRLLPCTGCKYCVSHCPMSLNIPELLKLYNNSTFTGGTFVTPSPIKRMPKEALPAACIGCRACEEVCPQNIKISEAMADFSAKIG